MSESISPGEKHSSELEDEQALTWGGDLPDQIIRAPEQPDPTQGAHTTVADDKVVAKTSGMLTTAYGVFAGVYLLYTVGWALFIFSHPIEHYGDLLPALMYELGESLTIVAPIFWFSAVLLVVKKTQVQWRVFWLIVGALVLVPWPFILAAVSA